MKTSFVARVLALGLATFMMLALPARADQIASNITGTDLGFWGIGEAFWSGVPFTTDNRGWTVDNVVAPVSQSTNLSLSGIFMRVYTNSGGQPGSPLGTKMVTPTITSTIADQTFTRIGAGASLAANTTYWMVIGVDDPASTANPIFRRTDLTPGAGPGSMGLTLWSSTNDGASWSFQNASDQFQSIRMQINGTPIPEPTGSLICGLGLAVLARRRSRISHV